MGAAILVTTMLGFSTSLFRTLLSHLMNTLTRLYELLTGLRSSNNPPGGNEELQRQAERINQTAGAVEQLQILSADLR